MKTYFEQIPLEVVRKIVRAGKHKKKTKRVRMTNKKRRGKSSFRRTT